MSAGTGVRHSEFNPSNSERLHFFQIWIEPATTGTEPSYEQIRFDPKEKQNRLKRLAGPAEGNGAVRINQDAHVFVAELARGAEIPYSLGSTRAAWVHVVRGEVAVNGVALRTGDAAAVSGEEHLALSGGNAESSEILLFDLA
jgi:redox-sensitive bicupin YhaK (pirin superfamily)